MDNNRYDNWQTNQLACHINSDEILFNLCLNLESVSELRDYIKKDQELWFSKTRNCCDINWFELWDRLQEFKTGE